MFNIIPDIFLSLFNLYFDFLIQHYSTYNCFIIFINYGYDDVQGMWNKLNPEEKIFSLRMAPETASLVLEAAILARRNIACCAALSADVLDGCNLNSGMDR